MRNGSIGALILAIGHSARDTFKKLYELGIDVSVEYVKLDAFSNIIDLNKAKLVTKENIDE